MTVFLRFIRNAFQRAFGSFYEGPNPPDRYGRTVVSFMQLHPRATKAEWSRFATNLAGAAYTAGYTRGYEAGERWPDTPFQEVSEQQSLPAPTLEEFEAEEFLGDEVIDERPARAAEQEIDDIRAAFTNDHNRRMGKRYSR